MGIGYLLLYAALAVVALWLVAEVLLQNRAPLHWRALALVGFLGVAAGMSLGSVVVIGAGAVLFAVGQTFVTLSVKRGYRDGWSLRKADGSLPGPLAKVPLLSALTGGGAAVAAVAVAKERIGEVSAVEEPPAVQPVPEELPEVEQTAAFAMQELAQDGIYAPAYYEQQPQQQAQDPYATAYQGGYDQQQWQTQQQPAFAYDQSYGAYPQQQDPQQIPQQQDPYGAYPQQQSQQQMPQQDQYAGYQQHQQAWDPNAQQQHQQQWQPQPDPQTQGIPPQPVYDQNYGYQQQNTWHQG
ncbi:MULTISPECIES: hypothetical protein [unclassified Kitasatospora]|uniref:hypothetical protein n=1 Tax=unclassified Kitasatospora TaxID=2633591 RepID=UPI0033FFD1A1